MCYAGWITRSLLISASVSNISPGDKLVINFQASQAQDCWVQVAVRIRNFPARASCSRGRPGANSDRNMDMRSFWKFLLLIFLFIGFVISCTEPPNSRMAELQRYYALKGEGIMPTIKKVALTTRVTTQADERLPVLSTTNAR